MPNSITHCTPPPLRTAHSDPRCEVFFNGISAGVTKATHTTIEPVWNETLEFDLEGLDECSHVTIVMKEVCACTSAWPHLQATATHTSNQRWSGVQTVRNGVTGVGRLQLRECLHAELVICFPPPLSHLLIFMI